MVSLFRFLEKMSIRIKLILAMLAIGLLPVILLIIVISSGAFGILDFVQRNLEGQNIQELTILLNDTLLRVIFTLLLAIIISITLSLLLSDSITKPIRKLTTVADKISNHDLTVDSDLDIEEMGTNELLILQNSFNTALQSLQNIIDIVQSTSLDVKQSSDDLRGLSDNMTILTGEISLSMSQISSGATTMANYAMKGSSDIDSLIKTINETVYAISNASSAINEIAEQTNILSLNAAIEAARAGQYGKGFAVVADNVRRLAEETRRNASQISELTGKVTSDIKTSIDSIQDSFQNFASQSEEFSASSEEVAAATEEQTASMNQLASAALMLNDLSSKLVKEISQFKI